MTQHQLQLNCFEGPLDLLLHLIRVNELDIFNVDLVGLTEQYLNFLRLIRFRDVNEASSFIAIAATLIELKTRRLLPNESTDSSETDPLLEDVDAAQLQERLQTLEQFQQVATWMGDRAKQAVLPVCSTSESIRLSELYGIREAQLSGDRHTLLVLYEQALSSISDKRPTSVQALKESLTVEDLLDKLDALIHKQAKILWQSIVQNMQSRYELVANILAFLQLARDGRISISQDGEMGPLWLLKPHSVEKPPIQGVTH